MEKHRTILLACTVIAGAAMLCGCSKTESGLHLSGEISFATASRGGQSTKTVYGDDVKKDDKVYQALNWVKNDVVTIASPQAVVQNDPNAAHASNYVISQVTATGVPSTAKVVNEAANGLMWLDNIDTYDFYAIYPKHEEGVITLTPAGEVEATIPATQNLSGDPGSKSESKTYESTGETLTVNYKVYNPDMKYAFMTAALKEFKPVSNTQTVPITFKPAFTAFEFNVSSQDDPIELTGFELLSSDGSDKLAGKFTMNADGTNISATGATSSVKADLSAADAIDDENGLTFTVFTVPVTNVQPLRIRFTSKDGETTKTSWLDLKYSNKEQAGDNAGKAVQFLAGHKYRIHMLKLPASQWKITITAVFEDWVPAEEEIVIYI